MTRQIGAQGFSPSNDLGCGKCAKVKQQAEDAFRELRTQADLHIAAIERKAGGRAELNAIAAEYEGRISQMERELTEMESRSKTEIEQILRKCKKDTRSLEMRVAELEELLTAEREDSNSSRWKIEKAKLDLAYRKRMGEMESEVRRTEIESVRLRKQIMSLTQKLEENGGLAIRDRFKLRNIFDEPPLPSGRIAKLSSRELEDVAL